MIDEFCLIPKGAQAEEDPKNRDCLVRVLLGRRRPFTPTYNEGFLLRKFEVDLQIVDDLELEKEHHAKSMAVALAVMHGNCETDAADVEFVLGTSPQEVAMTWGEVIEQQPRTESTAFINFKQRAVHLWMLDFNQCDQVAMDNNGVNKAVAAFWQNDPYFPRPQPIGNHNGPLWQVFKQAYLEQSENCKSEIARKRGLPEMFIRELEKEAMRQASTASAPPRGRPPPTSGPAPSGRKSKLSGPLHSEPPRGGPSRGGHAPVDLSSSHSHGGQSPVRATSGLVSAPTGEALGSPGRRGKGEAGRGRGGRGRGIVFDIPDLD